MEIDSPTPDRTPSSRRNPILERLALLGVPEEHRHRLYPGLVDFVRANPSMVSDVVSAILPTDEEVAEAQQESVQETKSRFSRSMVWLQWLMFEEEPIEVLEALALINVGQRGVCGAVWGNNDIAYKCRTCENDPTCAICVTCFQNGNHKDHDYSIIYTGGGCCDCGDETAWKREGFCSKHKGAEQIQPLPEGLAKSVGPVLDALFSCWKQMLLSAENVRLTDPTRGDSVTALKKRTNEQTFAIVEMLLEFCQYSESLLSFVSKKISSSADLLNSIVKAERYLSQDIVKILHELLLKLLGEPVFKSEFAKAIVGYYPVVINEALEQYNDNVLKKYPLLSKFSVQIFTVPTLTLHLVEEMNLLAMLFRSLGDIFAFCAGEDGRLEGTKWQRLYLTTNRVVSDIKFALSHDMVSKYATHEQRDLSRIWLRLLIFIQGMNPLKRETGMHIEEENEFMHYFFVLAHSIAPIHSLLVDGAYTAASNIETWDTCTSMGEQDMDDLDVERHAKVGRLTQEGSACSVSGSNVAFSGILKDAEVNSDVSCHALLPPFAIWLIRECLKVLEKCFGDDEGISRALSSQTAGNICSSNLSRLKRTLSNIEKGKYVFNRLGSLSGDRSTGSSVPFGNSLRSVVVENSGDLNRGTRVSVSNDTADQVSGRSASLNDNVSGAVCAVDSDASCFLGYSDWPEISYDVSSQDISVHIPLHRLISWLLLKALSQCYGESLLPNSDNSLFAFPCYTDFFRYVLGDCHPYGFSAFIMEHALRIRVFCAQVNAGMWRRSGDTALVSCEWYRSVRWSEQGLELDLFLLQCCGALAPADDYVNRVIDRFGLSSYLALGLERSNEYEPVLVQEMLTLIIQILQERRFTGLTMAESVKREMIYKLASGDATHSQLVKSLPRDLSQFDKLQEILDSIAVYSNPSGFNQGKYSLRPSYWKELDLYHPRWNSRELQVAEERYLRYCGMSALTAQLPRWTKIYHPLKGLAKVATCGATLQLLSAVLYYALYNDKSVESRAPDGVLITALHLLSLSLDVCKQQRAFNNHECNSEDSIPILSLAVKDIVGAAQGFGKQSLLSLLVSLMTSRKEDNFHRFGEAGNCDLSSWIRSLLRKFAEIDSACKKRLQHLAPEVVSHLSGTDASISGVTPDSDARKAKARERQAFILAKMKAEQSKFLSTISSSMDDDDSKAETGPSTSDVEQDAEDAVHEVCCLCHDPKLKEPVSFLIFLQRSKLLSFADRSPPSWEQARQTGKRVFSSVLDRPDLLETNMSSVSLRVISPRSLQLTEDTSGEFANNRHGDRNYLVEFVKARLTRNNAERMLDTLEQDMYLEIRKRYDEMKCKSAMLEVDEHPDSKSGPKSPSDDGQYVLLDKYFGSLAKEFHRSPSAFADFQNNNLLATSSSHAGYDGFCPTDCDGIHISSCGHAVHQGCLDRYLLSLKERSVRRSVFEGAHIVNPDQGEFLCPVCRRLANSVLPASPRDAPGGLKLPVTPDFASAIFHSPDRSNDQSLYLQLGEALCLLRSAADVIGKSDTLRALPITLRAFPLQRDDQRRLDLESVSCTLSKMYFSKRRDNFQEISLLNQSIIMWDVLKYSLMAMEVAARCGKTRMGPVLDVDSLYEEFKTSSGSILLLLFRAVQSTRTKNALHVLQRFRGMHLFAESICSATSVTYPSSLYGREGTVLGLRKNVQAAASGADILFWNRASDPILARDPFTSLMWVLFCLPFPCVSCKESLLSLVHIFYAVSLVQAVITCCAQNQFDSSGSGMQGNLLTDISEAIRGSECVQKYFVSHYLNSSSDIKHTLRKFSFPYLRRCALLLRLLNSPPVPFREKDFTLDTPSGSSSDMMDIVDGGQSDLSEIQELEKMFGIPSIDDVLNDKLLRSLSKKWLLHFQREHEVNRLQGCLYVTPAVPFRLMKLPHVYQDLLQRCFKQSCHNCRKVFDEPVLCLLCGRLCSPSWKSCCRDSGCQTHAMSCGAGTGVFLLIRRTTILLQRCARQASWPSPYLDAFGEEDLEMHRGKPLYLNEERYAALTYMVASHGLDRNSKVLAHTTIGSFLMI